MKEIKNVDIKSLKLLERNPRKITKEAMTKLCDSLIKDPNFLQSRPVLVNDKDGCLQVYAGNQRVQAAKKLKWKQIPCIIEKDLSDEMVKDRVVKDNQTFGVFDYDILAADYEIEDLLAAGFTPEQLEYDVQDLGETEEDDSEVLEPGKDEEAMTKLGDVYELNEHRIVCGDSTLPEYVEKVLNGQTPILMVTDPPYGVEYDPSWSDGGEAMRSKRGKKSNTKAFGKVQNDDKVNWSLAWYLFTGSVVYVWHAATKCAEVQKSLEEAEFQLISQIIWSKQNFAISKGDYHWHHEPCWYAFKKGQQHNWQGSRKESTIWEISSLNAFGKSKEDGEERTAHSNQKPIECMARPMRNNTAVGEGVYDPFLGSGTTLIAAEQLGRICYGIELSPAYCDIIVDRWKRFMEKNNRSYTIKKNGELV